MSDHAASLAQRLLGRDATLWPSGNVSPNRLGFLDVPRRMRVEAEDLSAWASSIDQGTIILLGMGGSSLGPAVLESVFAAHGLSGRRLVVCDTTDPTTVGALDFSDAFVLVSSKSGTTLEPNVLLAHAWSQLSDPARYAVITEPGTPLAALGREREFHRVFENPPDIGGRYSVLSLFGLVPAALMGVGIEALLHRCAALCTVAAHGKAP